MVCVRLLIPNSKAMASYIPIEKELIAQNSEEPVSTEIAIASRTQTSRTQNETPVNRLIMIDINSCDSVELMQLQGIGTVLSGRIIRFRNLLGGYASIEQLQEVYGLRPETYDMIKDKVTADTSLIDKIDVNTADFRRFSRLPYFDRQEINDLLRYRTASGKILDIDELIENNILSKDKVAKIKPYLSFNK